MNVFVSGVSVFPMAHLGRIAICGEGELEGKSADGFSHVEPTCFPRRRAHEPPGEEPVLRAPPTAFPLFLFFVIVNEPEMIPCHLALTSPTTEEQRIQKVWKDGRVAEKVPSRAAKSPHCTGPICNSNEPSRFKSSGCWHPRVDRGLPASPSGQEGGFWP